MEEKILKEIATTLEAIKAKLDVGSVSGINFRGPVADPAPGWYHGPITDPHFHPRGPGGDPPPWFLLDKEKLARLKINQIDTFLVELEKQIESLKLEKNLLKAEYKIK